MHSVSRHRGLAFVALALPVLLATCKGTTESPVPTSISISPPSVSLTWIGATVQLSAVVNDQHGNAMTSAAVTWASSNTAVITVSAAGGLASAVANGTSQITASSGSATGTISATVAQTAAQMAKVSGDGQSGTVGQALLQPITVQVMDANAHPISGASVAFATSAGSGTVGSPSATTDASGQAHSAWTLGQAAGTQTATATAGALTTALFTATAAAGAAASVAKQAGDGQTTGAGAQVPTAPAVIVKDAFNNLKPGVSVTFAVASGGGSITGATQATNASGVATVGSWTLGAAGTNTLTATVAGSGITGNPATFTATATPAGTSPSVVALVGNNQPGLVGYAVNVRPAVRVTDAGSAPVSGQTVTFAVATGGGSITGGTAVTNANGVAQVGKWTLGASAGVNTLTATVTGSGIAGNPVTFADTGAAASYSIQIQYYGPTPAATVQAAMTAAVTKWQQIIYRALSSVNLNLAATTACGDTTAPAINQTVSGVLILARFDSIDGPGKILGQAGPCLVRSSNSLSVLGVMMFDTADVASLITAGSLNSVILHEMGHVIGFGSLWSLPTPLVNPDCLQLPSDSLNRLDTYFSCPKARAAFDSIGGTSYTGASLSPPGGNKVPVENCGASSPAGCGAGTVNSHWREPVFGNELMTGWLNSGVPNPLSILSVAAQADLGYTVNYAGADAYTHTFAVRAAGSGVTTEMGDDIYRGPLYAVDDAGRIVRVIRR